MSKVGPKAREPRNALPAGQGSVPRALLNDLVNTIPLNTLPEAREGSEATRRRAQRESDYEPARGGRLRPGNGRW